MPDQLPLFRAPLTEAPPRVATPEMGVKILQRVVPAETSLLTQTYLRAVMPVALSAAEIRHGLPIGKASLLELFADPSAAISQQRPTTPETRDRLDQLLEFCRRRQADQIEYAQTLTVIWNLFAGVPDILLTPDGMPSPLYADDRSCARAFVAKLDLPDAAARDYLLEGIVLLSANEHLLRSSDIIRLYWPQDGGRARADWIAGCADGQARARLSQFARLPEANQRTIYSLIPLGELGAMLD